MENDRRIEARKRGTALGFWFFRIFMRLFGLRGGYWLLYTVCLYYLLFDREGVAGGMAYIRRRFPGHGRIRRYWDVYHLFVSQGRHLIDRYAALSGLVSFEYTVKGADRVLEVLSRPDRGMVLLTAHMGNWQIAMTELKGLEKKVFLVIRPEDNEALKRVLRIGQAGEYVETISPESHMGGVVEIVNALEAGNIVSMMGDRPYGFESADITFLGDKAAFPVGGFKVAASVGCPVVALLAARTGYRRYEVDMSYMIFPVYEGGEGRREKLRGWVQDFADELARFAGKYPYQCFLFRDVWSDDGSNPG